MISQHARRWLHTQGFDAESDEMLARAQHWLRVAPALCGVITATGTALALPWLLFALAAIAAAGAIAPRHPFDLIYTLGVRPLSDGPPLPRNGAPRRFACAMGAGWLAVTGLLFLADLDVAGYVLGGAFTAVAALVATTHICIPSTIFRAWESLAHRRATA